MDNSGFFSMHRARAVLSQVKALSWARPGDTIPSLSPMCAQAWRRFTQVIHMVVHSKPARSSPAGLAGSSGSAYWFLREAAGPPDART